MVYGKSDRFHEMKSQKELQFEGLYQSHKDKVYRLCLGFVREKELANDLFQEILIKIWRHLDSFKGESEISTWIFRIAYNTALTYFSRKKKKDEKQTEMSENLDLSEPEDYGQEQEIRIQMLYDAISELPELDRVIATLFLENTPYKVIAEISGISENYVAVKVNRIKTVLTQKLNPQPHGN